MVAPPDRIVLQAVLVATSSPCAKSKRGCVVFDAHDPAARALGIGHNGPPYQPPHPGPRCDGSEACRASCNKRCVHAEVRAIRDAIVKIQRGRVETQSLELVHAKTDMAGGIVAGGGPSCWQCSREVLDSGIAAVWLFEVMMVGGAMVITSDEEQRTAGPVGRWKRYTAIEFHAATCRACEVY